MPNPRQEQWCLDRLKSAILGMHPGATLRDERGCEPPDFWLDINDRRFAIEITTVRVEDDQTFWRSLCALVKRMERDAITRRELSGRYLVEACAALPSPVPRAKKPLAAAIRAYVCETKTASSSPRRELRVHGMLIGHISKGAAEGAKLYLAGGLTNTGACEHETRRELQELLNKRISEKRTKLAQCTHPTILVLYDCYSGEDETAGFVERIKASPDVSFFHTVFLIHSMGDEVFVHQSGPLVG